MTTTPETPALPGDLTDETIERAAIAFTCGLDEAGREEWAQSGEEYRALIMKDMRAALEAAGVAPVTPSEEIEHLRASVKHVADQMADALATLQMFADQIDEHVFGELASALDDQPLDFETGEVVGKAKAVPSPDREKLADQIRACFGTEIYVCGRDYTAWTVDTMSLDDFTLAAEDDDVIASLVDIALAVPPVVTK